MTKKKAPEKKHVPLIAVTYHCPDCLRQLPMRHPTPDYAHEPQPVECACGWSGEILPFVRADRVVD